MFWCSRREMCCSEIKLRLQKAEVDETSIKKILEKLIEENFINEERFVKAFVHDKLEYQKWGLAKIKNALYLKNIPKELITEAIFNVDKDAYISKLTEIALHKLKFIKAENDFLRDQKLLRFLASKGVSADDAFKIINIIKSNK